MAELIGVRTPNSMFRCMSVNHGKTTFTWIVPIIGGGGGQTKFMPPGSNIRGRRPLDPLVPMPLHYMQLCSLFIALVLNSLCSWHFQGHFHSSLISYDNVGNSHMWFIPSCDSARSNHHSINISILHLRNWPSFKWTCFISFCMVSRNFDPK